MQMLRLVVLRLVVLASVCGGVRGHIAVPPALSPFEQLAQQSTYACNHVILRSKCSDSNYAGIVLFFHGFSACATQINTLAPELNELCFDVVAPTLPGHGAQPISDCDAVGAVCTVRVDAKRGFDLRELPTKAELYLQFAVQMGALAGKERDYRAQATGKSPQELIVAAMGLSFGSPLATYAISHNHDIFTRQYLLNPEFGAGREMIDETLFECRSQHLDEKSCEIQVRDAWSNYLGVTAAQMDSVLGSQSAAGELNRKILTTMAMVTETHFDDPFVQAMLDKVFSAEVEWSAVCANIFNTNPPRGGFCKFQKRHVAATNSAGLAAYLYATNMHASAQFPAFPVTQIILTERDGMTRNGLSYAFIRRLLQQKQVPAAAMGMYRFRRGTDRKNPAAYWSDANSMPHAPLGAGVNMWWRQDLFTKIGQFFTGNGPLSLPSVWDGSREQCVGLSLGEDAFQQEPWLKLAVLPSAAPLHESEVQPQFASEVMI